MGIEEVCGGGARLVTRAKKARSVFRGGQGRVPRRPMPRVGLVATMRVSGGRGRGGMGVEVEVEVEVGEGGMVSWVVGMVVEVVRSMYGV